MASGVDASEEEGGHLWEHLLIRQLLAGLGVFGLEQKVRKAARLGLLGLDVVQQLPDDGLPAAKNILTFTRSHLKLKWAPQSSTVSAHELSSTTRIQQLNHKKTIPF